MKSRTKKTAEDYVQFSIRLPEQLRSMLDDLASGEGRSVNSLVVELLTEKVAALNAISEMAERDPLAAAWYAAESAEAFSRSIRGAIVRYRNQEKTADIDLNDLIIDAACEETHDGVLDEPAEQLTPFQRELLEEFSRIPPEKLQAMRTLIKR